MSARRIRSQRLGRDGDRLDVADRARVESAHGRPSGEMSKLGHDLARHYLHHLFEGRPDQLCDRGHGQRLPERIPERDRDAAGEDHVHRRDRLSRPAEELAVREPPDLAEPADAVDLGGSKDREHLVESRRQGAAGCDRLRRGPVLP
jgi:hypothetical protein